ncbi:zinc finger Y-chromosomal protein 1-like [Amphiura filiformis]|uniref:zinc finger Y-chromosomal protein 1-like n=1 Tax=Amphiura filiformis TaxID=82378 RepID=UPI003B2220C8
MDVLSQSFEKPGLPMESSSGSPPESPSGSPPGSPPGSPQEADSLEEAGVSGPQETVTYNLSSEHAPANYQCDRCGKTYCQPHNLREHIEAEHKGIKHTCKICGSKMKWKTNLNVHMAKVHNINEDPRRKATIKRKCEKCKIEFSSNELLYSHLIAVHNESKPVSCPACTDKFESTAIYNNHKFVHAHLVPYRCDVCKLRYSSKLGLQKHVQSSGHVQKCANWPVYKEFDDLDDMVCYICSKKFKFYSSFSVHMCGCRKADAGCVSVKHVKGTPLQICKFCKKTFKSQYHLQKHSMNEHSIIPKNSGIVLMKDGSKLVELKCKLCDKIYGNVSSLQTHMKVHGERNIKCDECEYRTYYKADMRKHKLKHNGEKPYKCPTCNKDFKSYTSRKHCMLRHAGTKPFQCSSCPKWFLTKTRLRYHEKVHKSKDSYMYASEEKEKSNEGGATCSNIEGEGAVHVGDSDN